MSYTGPDTGDVQIDGLDPAEWALTVFLPPIVPSILGQAVAIFVCYWEFVVLFPSEVTIWRRLFRKGQPFRWQFAPIMTILMRYLLLIYASAAAWGQYSTTMTDRSCVADSAVFIIAVVVLNTCSILAMAWRSHAVARGVIERTSRLRLMQGVLFLTMMGAITMVWYSMIQAQTVGSWLSKADKGICVSDFSYVQAEVNVAREPNFWYYITSILFDFTCMVVICVSLKKLSKRSTGFSKLIAQLFYHSLGYFVIIFLLFLLGIVWLRVQNAYWAANFIQMIQASIVIRILISEQNRAQRPHDTTFDDATYYAGGGAGYGGRTTQGGGVTFDSRYASDSRFAGVDGSTQSTAAGALDSRGRGLGDDEEGYEMKATTDSYSIRSGIAGEGDLESAEHQQQPPLPQLPQHPQHHDGGVRARIPRRNDSEYGGSMPSEGGQSSKTAHSDRSGDSAKSDGKSSDYPVVTVESLQR